MNTKSKQQNTKSLWYKPTHFKLAYNEDFLGFDEMM